MSGTTPLLSDLSAPCQPSVELAAAGRFMDIGLVPPFAMVSCSSRRLSVVKRLIGDSCGPQGHSEQPRSTF